MLAFVISIISIFVVLGVSTTLYVQQKQQATELKKNLNEVAGKVNNANQYEYKKNEDQQVSIDKMRSDLRLTTGELTQKQNTIFNKQKDTSKQLEDLNKSYTTFQEGTAKNLSALDNFYKTQSAELSQYGSRLSTAENTMKSLGDKMTIVNGQLVKLDDQQNQLNSLKADATAIKVDQGNIRDTVYQVKNDLTSSLSDQGKRLNTQDGNIKNIQDTSVSIQNMVNTLNGTLDAFRTSLKNYTLKTDLTNYATKGDLSSYNSNFANYLAVNDFNAWKQTLPEWPTRTEMNDLVNNFVTQCNLIDINKSLANTQQIVGNFQTTLAQNSNLYASKTDFIAANSNIALTQNMVNNLAQQFGNSSLYVKPADLTPINNDINNAKATLTSISQTLSNLPSVYVTQAQLTNVGNSNTVSITGISTTLQGLQTSLSNMTTSIATMTQNLNAFQSASSNTYATIQTTNAMNKSMQDYVFGLSNQINVSMKSYVDGTFVPLNTYNSFATNTIGSLNNMSVALSNNYVTNTSLTNQLLSLRSNLEGQIKNIQTNTSNQFQSLQVTGSFLSSGSMISTGPTMINDIRISRNFVDNPASNVTQADIANDTTQFKKLVIAGNTSGGSGRRVGIMDNLDVANNLSTGSVADANIFNARQTLQVQSSNAWMRNDGSMYATRLGVGAAPDAKKTAVFQGGAVDDWQVQFTNPNGNRVISMNHGDGNGISVETNDLRADRIAMSLCNARGPIQQTYNDGRQNLLGQSLTEWNWSQKTSNGAGVYMNHGGGNGLLVDTNNANPSNIAFRVRNNTSDLHYIMNNGQQVAYGNSSWWNWFQSTSNGAFVGMNHGTGNGMQINTNNQETTKVAFQVTNSNPSTTSNVLFQINNNGAISSLRGTTISSANPGPMIEKRYVTTHDGDRYGIGQFSNGVMRMYTAKDGYNGSVALSGANSNGTFYDGLTMNPATKTVKVDKLQLGDRFILSGIGDPYTDYVYGKEKWGGDQWLRLTGPNTKYGPGIPFIYGGGFAASELWTNSGALSGSDQRLKENIKAVTDDDIDKLSQLQPKTFYMKQDIKKTQKYGFIAQDVEQTYPSIVREGPDNGIKGLNYNEFTPLIVGKLNKMDTELKTKERLCIDDVCITKDELKSIKDFARKSYQ